MHANPIDPSELLRSEGTLRALHDITTSPSLAFPQQVRRILAVGANQLRFPVGVVSRLDDGQLRAEYVGNPTDGFGEGTVYEICESFCGHVFNNGEALGVHDANVDGWRDHAGRTKLGIQSYLGMPIKVLGRTWGTVCFFDTEPRDEPFSDSDYELLNLIGQRIQVGVEHDAVQRRFRAALSGVASAVGDEFLRGMVAQLAHTLELDVA